MRQGTTDVACLRLADGEVVIRDAVRNCKTCSRFLKGTQSAPFSSSTHASSMLTQMSRRNWFGNEVRHELQITYGLSGSITYRAWVAPNFRQPQLIYTATGDMGSSASLKVSSTLEPPQFAKVELTHRLTRSSVTTAGTPTDRLPQWPISATSQ